MDRKNFDEMYDLLPEYVKGNLAKQDAARLEAALEDSEELQDALERERLLQQRFVSGAHEMLDEAEKNSKQRLDAVMEKAEGGESAKDNGQESMSLSSALSFLNPKRWKPAIALTLALAVPVQAAVIASQATSIASLEDENFRLASGPCAEEQGKGRLLAEFADDASWSDVAGLLDAEDLIIVKRGSFGSLELRSKKEGDALAAVIERLRASPIVTSAEVAR